MPKQLEMFDDALDKLALAGGHRENCDCPSCLRWWVQLGPLENCGPEGYGPFTAEQIAAAAKKIEEDDG